MKNVLFCLLAIGLVGCGKEPQSDLNSYCKNPKELVDVAQYEGTTAFSKESIEDISSSVGMLIYKDIKLCTVTAISDYEIVTAHHCLQGNEDQEKSEYKITFNYKKDLNGNVNEEKLLNYGIEEFVSKGNDDNIDSPDAVIIKLDAKIDSSVKRRWFSSDKPTIGQNIAIVQHPKGKPLMVDVGNISALDKRGFFEYDNISTLSGSSGASIFDENGNILGLHVRGGCSQYVDGGNVGLSMKLLYEKHTWFHVKLKDQFDKIIEKIKEKY